MSTDLAVINTELETEIRLKADTVKRELSKFKEMGMECMPNIEDPNKVCGIFTT